MVSRVAQRWNPQRYLRFESQRLRPALDLLGQIHHANPRRIVDLGCGTGNITPFLRARWPAANILCLDSSKDMLDQARSNHLAQGLEDNVDYMESDFESFQTDDVDILFSNAALHWVSFEVHQRLLPQFVSLLNPKGGVLAFQIPDSRAQNSHLMMQRAMEELGFDHDHVRWVTTEVEPNHYYDLLAPLCTDLNMWSTTFVHSMQGENPIADFTASTGLGPYVKALGGPTTTQGQLFISKYRDLIQTCYPKQSDGKTLYSVKRFFLVAKLDDL